MEDKELFEKVEKAFGITENKKIQKIYESGNFKKQLDEVVTSKNPSGGGGNLIGAIGQGLGALRGAIPGTRAHKMRTAELRKSQAEARKAELENARLFAKLQRGDLSDDQAQDVIKNMVKNASEIWKRFYNEDARFKYAVDMGVKGKWNELSDADREHHKKVMEKIDQLENEKKAEEKEKEQKEKEQKQEEKLTKDKLLTQVPEFLEKTLKERIGNNNQFQDLKINIGYFQGKDISDALTQFAILNLNAPTFQVQKTDKKNIYYEIFGKAIARTGLQQAIEGQYSLEDIEDGKISESDLDVELADAKNISEVLLLKVLPKSVLDRRKDFVTDNIDDYFASIRQIADRQTKLPIDNGGEKSEEPKKEPVQKSAKRKKADAKRLKTPEEIGAEAKKILADKIKKKKPKYNPQNLDDVTDQA